MLNLTFRPNIFEKDLRFSKVMLIFALLKETTLLTINPRPPAEYKQARNYVYSLLQLPGRNF